jgi:hypothetical protein
MIIIGAGQAGLLAARSMSIHNPTIIEQQEELPNNHSALLRFRSSIVGDSVGIPFQKVRVYKGVLQEDAHTITNNPTIRDANAYSYKTTGKAIERSIINTEDVTRYIAPPNFIQSLASGADITYNQNAKDCLHHRTANLVVEKDIPVISTIPMPILMDILNYPDYQTFQYLPIWTINCELEHTSVYQTLYVPYDKAEPYRVSITGNIMTLEFCREPNDPEMEYISYYLDTLSIYTEVKNITNGQQSYGKIVPIDEYERQKFILWATQNHNIYSLGRFATWRNILLDDVMKDIKIINSFILQSNSYQRNKHTATKE